MANITVAVRVRPLTARENARRDSVILKTEQQTITLRHPRESEYNDNGYSERNKQFKFDYCYASGSRSGKSDQEQVYSDIGERVLDSLFEGYNCCVLAYGQSGAGKTYTMVGKEDQPGLIPRLCAALFERTVEASVHSKISFKIDVSFLEIYNEKVRDLLRTSPEASVRSSSDLRVREHPQHGPYVQDLSRHVVGDADSALSLLYRGMQRRVAASTHTNVGSSRSHAVFTIHCTAAKLDGDFPSETTAKLHLVDLAGSERACREVSRVRLKEGANINRSLACLGNVINALAERGSSGVPARRSVSNFSLSTSTSSNSGNNTPYSASPAKRKKSIYIPYRDSVLTWILKDSLGGNSRTFMVAVVSPSGVCYHETLSTLRFAQRAKRVVNKPSVNEEAGVKLIRHLKEEVARLRTILSSVNMAEARETRAQPRLVELMKVNEDRVDELTEEWLHKWRCEKLDDAKLRFSDVAVQTLPWLLNARTQSPGVAQQIDRRHAIATTTDDDDDDAEESSTDHIPVKDVPLQAGDASENEFTDDSLERNLRPSTPPRFLRRIHARKPQQAKPHVRTIFQQRDEGSNGERVPLTPSFDETSSCVEETASQLAVPSVFVSPPAFHGEAESDSTNRHSPGRRVVPISSERKSSPEQLIDKLCSLMDKFQVNSFREHGVVPLRKQLTNQNCFCHHHCHHHCCLFPSHPSGHRTTDVKLKNLVDFRNELLNYRRYIVAQTASENVRKSLSYLSNSGPSVSNRSSLYRNYPGETWI